MLAGLNERDIGVSSGTMAAIDETADRTALIRGLFKKYAPEPKNEIKVDKRTFTGWSDIDSFEAVERCLATGKLASKLSEVLTMVKGEIVVPLGAEDSTCYTCRLTFYSPRHLQYHHQFIENEKSFVSDTTADVIADFNSFDPISGMVFCPWCPVLFRGPLDLVTHMKTCRERTRHTEVVRGRSYVRDDFVCYECEESFPQEAGLWRHIYVVHGRHYKCSKCEEEFSSRSKFLGHIPLCTGPGKLVCCDCSEPFPRQRFLYRHVTRTLCSLMDPYICVKCGLSFDSRKLILTHLWKHARISRASAPECPELSKLGISLEHPVIREIPDVPLILEAPILSEPVKTAEVSKRNIAAQTGGPPQTTKTLKVLKPVIAAETNEPPGPAKTLKVLKPVVAAKTSEPPETAKALNVLKPVQTDQINESTDPFKVPEPPETGKSRKSSKSVKASKSSASLPRIPNPFDCLTSAHLEEPLDLFDQIKLPKPPNSSGRVKGFSQRVRNTHPEESCARTRGDYYALDDIHDADYSLNSYDPQDSNDFDELPDSSEPLHNLGDISKILSQEPGFVKLSSGDEKQLAEPSKSDPANNEQDTGAQRKPKSKSSKKTKNGRPAISLLVLDHSYSLPSCKEPAKGRKSSGPGKGSSNKKDSSPKCKNSAEKESCSPNNESSQKEVSLLKTKNTSQKSQSKSTTPSNEETGTPRNEGEVDKEKMSPSRSRRSGHLKTKPDNIGNNSDKEMEKDKSACRTRKIKALPLPEPNFDSVISDASSCLGLVVQEPLGKPPAWEDDLTGMPMIQSVTSINNWNNITDASEPLPSAAKVRTKTTEKTQRSLLNDDVLSYISETVGDSSAYEVVLFSDGDDDSENDLDNGREAEDTARITDRIKKPNEAKPILNSPEMFFAPLSAPGDVTAPENPCEEQIVSGISRKPVAQESDACVNMSGDPLGAASTDVERLGENLSSEVLEEVPEMFIIPENSPGDASEMYFITGGTEENVSEMFVLSENTAMSSSHEEVLPQNSSDIFVLPENSQNVYFIEEDSGKAVPQVYVCPDKCNSSSEAITLPGDSAISSSEVIALSGNSAIASSEVIALSGTSASPLLEVNSVPGYTAIASSEAIIETESLGNPSSDVHVRMEDLKQTSSNTLPAPSDKPKQIFPEVSKNKPCKMFVVADRYLAGKSIQAVANLAEKLSCGASVEAPIYESVPTYESVPSYEAVIQNRDHTDVYLVDPWNSKLEPATGEKKKFVTFDLSKATNKLPQRNSPKANSATTGIVSKVSRSRDRKTVPCPSVSSSLLPKGFPNLTFTSTKQKVPAPMRLGGLQFSSEKPTKSLPSFYLALFVNGHSRPAVRIPLSVEPSESTANKTKTITFKGQVTGTITCPPADASPDLPTNVSADVPRGLPTNVAAGVPPSLPTNVAADVPPRKNVSKSASAEDSSKDIVNPNDLELASTLLALGGDENSGGELSMAKDAKKSPTTQADQTKPGVDEKPIPQKAHEETESSNKEAEPGEKIDVDRTGHRSKTPPTKPIVDTSKEETANTNRAAVTSAEDDRADSSQSKDFFPTSPVSFVGSFDNRDDSDSDSDDPSNDVSFVPRSEFNSSSDLDSSDSESTPEKIILQEVKVLLTRLDEHLDFIAGRKSDTESSINKDEKDLVSETPAPEEENNSKGASGVESENKENLHQGSEEATNEESSSGSRSESKQSEMSVPTKEGTGTPSKSPVCEEHTLTLETSSLNEAKNNQNPRDENKDSKEVTPISENSSVDEGKERIDCQVSVLEEKTIDGEDCERKENETSLIGKEEDTIRSFSSNLTGDISQDFGVSQTKPTSLSPNSERSDTAVNEDSSLSVADEKVALLPSRKDDSLAALYESVVSAEKAGLPNGELTPEKNQEILRSDKDKIVCNRCNRTFKNAGRLKIHRKKGQRYCNKKGERSLNNSVSEKVSPSLVSEKVSSSSVSEKVSRSSVSEKVSRSLVSEKVSRSSVSEKVSPSSVSEKVSPSSVSDSRKPPDSENDAELVIKPSQDMNLSTPTMKSVSCTSNVKQSKSSECSGKQSNVKVQCKLTEKFSGPVLCLCCNRTFLNEVGRKIHITRMKAKLSGTRKIKKKRKNSGRFLCPYCDRSFGSSLRRSVHLIFKHDKPLPETKQHESSILHAKPSPSELNADLKHSHDVNQREENDFLEPILKENTLDIAGEEIGLSSIQTSDPQVSSEINVSCAASEKAETPAKCESLVHLASTSPKTSAAIPLGEETRISHQQISPLTNAPVPVCEDSGTAHQQSSDFESSLASQTSALLKPSSSETSVAVSPCEEARTSTLLESSQQSSSSETHVAVSACDETRTPTLHESRQQSSCSESNVAVSACEETRTSTLLESSQQSSSSGTTLAVSACEEARTSTLLESREQSSSSETNVAVSACEEARTSSLLESGQQSSSSGTHVAVSACEETRTPTLHESRQQSSSSETNVAVSACEESRTSSLLESSQQSSSSETNVAVSACKETRTSTLHESRQQSSSSETNVAVPVCEDIRTSTLCESRQPSSSSEADAAQGESKVSAIEKSPQWSPNSKALRHPRRSYEEMKMLQEALDSVFMDFTGGTQPVTKVVAEETKELPVKKLEESEATSPRKRRKRTLPPSPEFGCTHCRKAFATQDSLETHREWENCQRRRKVSKQKPSSNIATEQTVESSDSSIKTPERAVGPHVKVDSLIKNAETNREETGSKEERLVVTTVNSLGVSAAENADNLAEEPGKTFEDETEDKVENADSVTGKPVGSRGTGTEEADGKTDTSLEKSGKVPTKSTEDTAVKTDLIKRRRFVRKKDPLTRKSAEFLYRCKICLRWFPSRQALFLHEFRNKEMGPSGKCFPRGTQAPKSSKEEEKKKKRSVINKCETCGRKFNSLQALKSHEFQSKRSGLKSACMSQAKKKSLNKLKSLRSLTKSHVPDTNGGETVALAKGGRRSRFWCTPCGRSFKSNKALLMHNRQSVRLHKIKGRSEQKRKGEEGQSQTETSQGTESTFASAEFNCTKCGGVFKTFRQLSHHKWRSKKYGPTSACHRKRGNLGIAQITEEIKENAVDKTELPPVVDQVDPNVDALPKPPTQNRRRTCSTCEREFKSEKALRLHKWHALQSGGSQTYCVPKEDKSPETPVGITAEIPPEAEKIGKESASESLPALEENDVQTTDFASESLPALEENDVQTTDFASESLLTSGKNCDQNTDSTSENLLASEQNGTQKADSASESFPSFEKDDAQKADSASESFPSSEKDDAQKADSASESFPSSEKDDAQKADSASESFPSSEKDDAQKADSASESFPSSEKDDAQKAASASGSEATRPRRSRIMRTEKGKRMFKNSLYPCNLCSADYGYIKLLFRHVETVHVSPEQHRCKDCGDLFNSHQGLQIHLTMKEAKLLDTIDITSKWLVTSEKGNDSSEEGLEKKRRISEDKTKQASFADAVITEGEENNFTLRIDEELSSPYSDLSARTDSPLCASGSRSVLSDSSTVTSDKIFDKLDDDTPLAKVQRKLSKSPEVALRKKSSRMSKPPARFDVSPIALKRRRLERSDSNEVEPPESDPKDQTASPSEKTPPNISDPTFCKTSVLSFEGRTVRCVSVKCHREEPEDPTVCCSKCRRCLKKSDIEKHNSSPADCPGSHFICMCPKCRVHFPYDQYSLMDSQTRNERGHLTAEPKSNLGDERRPVSTDKDKADNQANTNIKSCTNDIYDDVPPVGSIIKTCALCREHFESYSKLERHLKFIHMNLLTCLRCGMCFSETSNWETHVQDDACLFRREANDSRRAESSPTGDCTGAPREKDATSEPDCVTNKNETVGSGSHYDACGIFHSDDVGNVCSTDPVEIQKLFRCSNCHHWFQDKMLLDKHKKGDCDKK